MYIHMYIYIYICVCAGVRLWVTSAGVVLASGATSIQALSGGTLTWRPLLRWGWEELKSSDSLSEAGGRNGCGVCPAVSRGWFP